MSWLVFFVRHGFLVELHDDNRALHSFPTRRASDLAQELIAFTREHIAHYKCPRSIDFEAELPRLPTGKLYKRLLRDEYWGKTGSRIV